MVARWKKKRGNPAVAESSLFCYNGVYSWLCLSIGFCRNDRNITSVLAAHLELHCTVYQGVESVVAAHADVLARVAPPNILTPNLLLADSRPFLELPTPFLCAMSSSCF